MLKSGMPIRSGPTTLTCSSLPTGSDRAVAADLEVDQARASEIGRRAIGATLRRSTGRASARRRSSPARDPSLGASLWISPGASAGSPRSRSTSPDGTLSNCAFVERRLQSPRCAHRRSDRTWPTRRPTSAGGPAPALGGDPGSARRSKLDRSSSNDRSSALGLGARCGRAGARSGRDRRGSAGRPAGRSASEMSDAGSALAPPARLGGGGLRPRARCGWPERCAAMSSTHSPR